MNNPKPREYSPETFERVNNDNHARLQRLLWWALAMLAVVAGAFSKYLGKQ